MSAVPRDVLEGEIITRPGEGTDEDQWSKYEEFRQSREGQDQNILVNVYLQPTNADGSASQKGPLEHLFTCPIDQFTREQIISKVRDEFMNVGDVRWLIRIQMRRPGTRGLLLNQLETVRRATAVKGDVSGEQHGDVQGILSQVNKMLADSQARMETLLRGVLEKPQAPQVNPIELFMLGQKQSAEMFEKLALAMKPNASERTSMTDGFTDVLKLLTMMQSAKSTLGDVFGGGAPSVPSGSSAAEIIKAVTPIASPLIQWIAAQQAAKAGKTLPAPAAANPASAASPVETPPKEKEIPVQTEDKMLYAMRDSLGALADAIALNPDVETIGAKVLESIPEEDDDTLYSLLSKPDWFDRFAAVQPKLHPHKEWMTKLRDYILKSFTDD
jgi:hypothetical protein